MTDQPIEAQEIAPEAPEKKDTYFELIVQGLKSLPFENHGAAVQRTEGEKPDEKPAGEALDGSGKVRKEPVQPGKYAVILEEIMDEDTDWLLD